jgi:UDP-N-acetylmuramate dehydrogenase
MPETEKTFDPQLLRMRLVATVGADNVRTSEPMSAHTTFQCGGPADLYVIPHTADEVRACVERCRESGAPYFLLGCGSDLLVSDAGYRGVIIAISDGLRGMSASGTRLTFAAGVTLKDATAKACELGLTGFEFACGIPGSIGGACFMNAGAYDGQMADVLESVEVIMPDGEYATIPASELALGYRTSRVRTDGLVVLSATVALAPGDPVKIQAKMDDLNARRAQKQPLEYGSAGSTFKRPTGYFVGKLVTDAGLKGYRVGNAAVSTKHGGFVVNLGGATAADVHAVIEHVQAEVKRLYGVELEPEVRFLG